MADANGIENTSQVRIQLTTRHPDIALPEETGPILVSTNLRRYALSTLVNNLLETAQPTPFDFIINGQFLRTSLDEFLTATGTSAESTLTVEYVPALVPPQHVSSFEHDDWVSAVDVLSSTSNAGSATWAGAEHAIAPGQEKILSASYDGLLRVWNTSSELETVSSGSSAVRDASSIIKTAKWLSPRKVASAGMDCTVRLWDYSAPSQPGSESSLRPTLELYGHTRMVQNLAIHTPSARLITASGDHSIGLFSTSRSTAPEAPANLLPKRRKLSKTSDDKVAQRGPLSLMTGHTAPATAVLFAPQDNTVAYSTSWDKTLRTWDLVGARTVDTRSTAHPLSCLTSLPGVNLLLAGTTARHIVGLDPRAGGSSGGRVAAMTLRGHGNDVASLDAQPGNAWGAVSASHDGELRVWDVRNAKTGTGVEAGEGMVGGSVFVVERDGMGKGKNGERRKPVGGEGVKVFSVNWDENVGIVSGGEDRTVQIHRSIR